MGERYNFKGEKAKRFVLPPVRVTEVEFNRVKHLAKRYTDGNLSAWVRDRALRGDQAFVKKVK